MNKLGLPTPGPWKVHYDQHNDRTDTLIIADTPAPQTVIAEVKFHFSTPIGEDAANATLISIAPEMLEALEDAAKELRWLWQEAENGTNEAGPSEIIMAKLDAILAKARGE